MLRWAIRQSLIGIFILAILVAGGAWLTYNGIDLDQEALAKSQESQHVPSAAARN